MAIEEAASNCYDSQPSSEGKIMASCIKSGHTSVTEFTTFTFHVSGVSRSLLAQITRHRHASFAVRSQRYCNEDGFKYIIPHTIKKNSAAYDIYKNTIDKIKNAYSTLQKLDIPNEDARYILPNACETTFEISINLRSLMNFMNERLCSRAQWEIRELAQMMKKEIINKYPEFEPYLVPKCEKYGKGKEFCPEGKGCGKYKSLKSIMDKFKKVN